MTTITSYQAHIHPSSYRTQPFPLDHPFNSTYFIQLNDQSWLEIPLCALPNNREAIALLMSNQSSFPVIEHLTTLMAQKASTLQPDTIVAVPTMGLEYASRIAQKLGKTEYVAMGFSHKYWYDEAISEPVISTTSPDQQKKLYLDPHLLPRVKGKRVVVIDDVINTGSSVMAAMRLLTRAGANVVGCVVALTEGHTWEGALQKDPLLKNSQTVLSIGHIPIFSRQDDKWVAQPETL